MMAFQKILRALFISTCTLLLSGIAHAEVPFVNLYSAQKEHLIRPILDEFEQQTGIEVRMTTGEAAGIVSRLEAEGEQTPADVLLTVDIGNLHAAKEKGLLQGVSSKILEAQIPEYLRDPKGQWFGLAVRARAILYRKDKVSPDAVETYESLANPAWQKKLLIRSSTNVYNQSLVASMIAHNGEKATRDWLKGMVANFARPPKGGDTDQIRALAAGEGELAVANTYYYARLLAGDADIQDESVKRNVGIILPNQAGRGAHINIRGGGVTAYAKHKENAVALLEFLAGDKAQSFFAETNFEYPAKSGIKVPEILAEWGELKRDMINLEEVGVHQKKAMELMDEAGWR